MSPARHSDIVNFTTSYNTMTPLMTNNLDDVATSTDTVPSLQNTDSTLNQTAIPRNTLSRFMKLFPELRNQMYEYVFAAEAGQKRSFTPHPLTHTNRQIRLESLGLYCSHVQTIYVPLLSPKQEMHTRQWLDTNFKRCKVLAHLTFVYPGVGGWGISFPVTVCRTRLVLVYTGYTGSDVRDPFVDALNYLYDSYIAFPGVNHPVRSENHIAYPLRCT